MSELENAAKQLKGMSEEAQPSIPLPYIILKRGEDNQIQAAEERTQQLLSGAGSLKMAEIKYAMYLDPTIISSPASVWAGPDFPYIFRWVTMAGDPHSSDLRNRSIMQGFVPVDIRKPEFQDKLVLGDDALLLGIDRSPEMMRNYNRTKTPVPAPLPDRLKDRWGTVLKPIADPDGRVILGQRMLFYADRTLVKQRADDNRKRANQDINVTGGNMLPGSVGSPDRPWEFPIPD